MKKSKKKLKLTKKAKIILALVGVLLIAGIAFLIVHNSKQKPIEPVEQVEEQEEEKPKLQILDLDSPSRPIAVMINNISVARPYQSGLQDAYLVYEMIVEGGITRMLAVFKDADTARIGTIRSSRPYYLDYVLENDAIYVHWGYSEQAYSDINKLHINNVNGLVYGNTYFWKDKSLKVSTEHTAYSSMELINKAIEKLKYRSTTDASPLLNYSVDELDYSNIEGVIPAQQVDIKYSSSATTSYTYDTDTKTYKRSVNGKSHTDYVTKKQYTAKNIITYQVKNTTIPGDVKGRQTLSNIGTGSGYYISNGYAIPITWEKKSREAKTIYKLKDGTELKVNDGNTYIQIQPTGQSLTIT